LVEVMIVIAILGIIVAIVYPNVFPRDTAATAATESALIDQTKAMAVARAEPLRLNVARDGAWEIVAENAPGAVLLAGRLAEAPPAPFAVRVTELGACLPVESERRVEGPVVDAVSCTVRP
jgi:hypothetical protein